MKRSVAQKVLTVVSALAACHLAYADLTSDEKSLLETKLAAKGISARYGEDFTVTSGDVGPGTGINLYIKGTWSVEMARTIKPTVEAFLADRGIQRYKYLGAWINGESSPHITPLEVRKATPKPVSWSSFNNDQLSFKYPSDMATAQKTQTEKIGTTLEPMDISTVCLLRASDGSRALHIARKASSSTFDALLEEKKAVSKEVKSRGVKVMGDSYTTFTASPTTIGDIKAVYEYGERADGSVCVAYEFLSGGFDYAAMFIYQNRNSAMSDRQVRDQLIGTLRVVTSAVTTAPAK